MSGFSHGLTTVSPPHGVRRQRSTSITGPSTPRLREDDAFVVSSPHSGRTVKRGKQEGGFGGGQTGDVRSSTPVSPTPLRAAGPSILPLGDFHTTSHIAPEANADPIVTQINTLLQQAAMLALEASHLVSIPNEHLRRTHCLLRTLDSLFPDARESLAARSAMQDPPPATSPIGHIPSTYAAALVKPAATKSTSGRSAAAPPKPSTGSGPPMPKRRRATAGRPQKLNSYRSSRIIVRLSGPPIERHETTLMDFYDKLQRSLSSPVGPHLRGVDFTRSGNIAIAVAAPTTAEQLLTQEDTILHILRRTTGFSGSITLELDGSWCGLVLHNVPVRLLADEDEAGEVSFGSWETRLVQGIEESSGVRNVQASCRRFRALTREGSLSDLSEKDIWTVSIRVDLSSWALAELLQQQGLYFQGVYCRVSQYRERRK
ncbi:hypothetical protein SCHPADRAFT_943835 [Schizopora paradoxa]|uniref:Uncharacterized protein n=1 Tax=Schizopora paradoxa TaxID=27342 RepID=A0A0H2RCC2_9AGAM|nr:hypothetical protein SCHPADRAFT_943835 [Schizopora paradoxa]